MLRSAGGGGSDASSAGRNWGRSSELLSVQGIVAILGLPPNRFATAQDSDDKLAQRVAAIDKKLVKALEDLTVQYDKEGDAEAASFFAECAVGFGSKDEKVKAIRLGWELDVYLGKVQGGKPLGKANPIETKLSGSAKEYKAVIEELERKWTRRKIDKVDVTEGERKTLFDVAVKYEIARGAVEYIKSTKRANELRRGMKLRSILWDFENSRKLILGAAPAADAWGEYFKATEKVRDSAFYSEDAFAFMVENSARTLSTLRDWLDEDLRPGCVWRDDLLNPNARRLWLGHWEERTPTSVTVYRIPLLPYREDVPTPTRRFEGETVAKDWVDTEETFELKGRKIPLAYYPFDGEKDLPWKWSGNETINNGPAWKADALPKRPGLPVMFRFFGKAELSEGGARLAFAASDKEIPSRVYTNGDERCPGIGDWPTVILVPEEELAQGVTYSVTVKCKLGNAPVEKTWRFTTRQR